MSNLSNASASFCCALPMGSLRMHMPRSAANNASKSVQLSPMYTIVRLSMDDKSLPRKHSSSRSLSPLAIIEDTMRPVEGASRSRPSSSLQRMFGNGTGEPEAAKQDARNRRLQFTLRMVNSSPCDMRFWVYWKKPSKPFLISICRVSKADLAPWSNFARVRPVNMPESETRVKLLFSTALSW